HQLVLRGRLHRQVGRFLALEDAVDVAGCLPVLLDLIGSIRDQTTRSYEGTQEVERRQLVLRRKRDDQVAMKERQRAWRYNHAAIGSARELCLIVLNLVGVARIKRDCLDAEGGRYGLDCAEHPSARGYGRIAKNCGTRYRWRDLLY